MSQSNQTSDGSRPGNGRTASTAPVEIDGADLPAFCPNPKMTLWNHHPRVYLDLGPNGVGTCPYCGTQYVLKSGTRPASH